MNRIGIVLIGIVFYRGLIVVTILMVIPNGNAHYYYSRILMLLSVANPVRSMYLGVLTIAILMLIIIL